MILFLAAALAQEEPAFLFREIFDRPALTPGVWDARIEPVTKRHIDPCMQGPRLAGFDSIGGGYLHFWSPRKGEEEPSLYSLKTFARAPGRCLAVAYCGTVHRGPSPTLQFASAIRPADKLAAGPGWTPGQRQGGPFINSAAPFGEGFRGSGHGNNNVDTLFLVVLRERGAFYLMADGPRARLCAVTETGAGGPYHVALTGGSAHGRFHAAAVADLKPEWLQERILRTGVLVEEGSDPFLEARVTPAPGTSSVSLVVRDHYRLELSAAGARWTEKDRLIVSSPEPRLVPGTSNRLTLRVEGAQARITVDDVPLPFAAEIGGACGRVGLFHAGAAPEFERLVAWPSSVPLPKGLAELLPPIVGRADGEIVAYDDFQGDGPLQGRTPVMGNGTWEVLKGEWKVEAGAARLTRAPGFVTLDTGRVDYEISATIEMRGPPDFPAVLARVDRPRPSSWITARYLWQSASPEIEVWDQPGGDWPTILINATNITGLIRPAETHVLRLAVRGNRVSYYRDDLLVGTSATRVGSGSRAGLEMASGGNADCRWLDFTVRAFRNR